MIGIKLLICFDNKNYTSNSFIFCRLLDLLELKICDFFYQSLVGLVIGVELGREDHNN
jgi:hypothetical protein